MFGISLCILTEVCVPVTVFAVSGFGFRGFGFQVSGFSGFVFRVSGFGFRVLVFGFRVSGFGFRVQGLGFRFSGRYLPLTLPILKRLHLASCRNTITNPHVQTKPPMFRPQIYLARPAESAGLQGENSTKN